MDEKTFNRLVEHQRRQFDIYIEDARSNSKGLDNVIFVISTGLFVLSINYLTGLKDNALSYPWVLIASWSLLAGGIIAHIISYKLAVKYARGAIDKLGEWGVKGFKPLNYVPTNEPDMKSKEQKINMLDNTALWLTILGVIALLFFTSVNFLANNIINKNKENKKIPEVVNNYYYNQAEK